MRSLERDWMSAPGRGHDVIVIGASAGGLEGILTLVRAMPADLPAAIFVVLHISPQAPSLLPQILQKASRLSVASPEDGMKIERGHIYVAPRDHHLLIERDHVRVVRGPKENRHRPALDPLFRSAAFTHGPHVAGVVLSGGLDDGTAGLWAVKTCGGVAIVQDPREAAVPDMPNSALGSVHVDHCLTVERIAELLIRLVQQPVASAPVAHPHPEELAVELDYTTMKRDIKDMGKLGTPSGFTCPSCHGALWELSEGELLRYRCHVGHAFSPDSLLAEQSVGVEDALYAAVRALEEKASISRRIGERLRNGLLGMQDRYEATARELEESAAIIGNILLGRKPAALAGSEPAGTSEPRATRTGDTALTQQEPD
jgi:two-component system, chemotaxis family, protein-glutamate methylesterase/glutaminase